jgi:acyl-coenzyme A synthetase/AMP-(fatty) acid ligase
MIYEYFARFAKETPNAPAIIHGDGIQTSYLQAFAFLNALMVVLRADCPELERQQPVGVACASRRLHMLLMFALEALGITTMNFEQPIDIGVADTVAICGLFIGELRPDNARHFLKLDQAFFDKVTQLSGKVTAVPAIWDPDRPVRVTTTSGSTGKAKIIPMPYQVQRNRVERRVWLYGLDANTRMLLAMAMTGPVVHSVQATFSQGGAAIFLHPARLAEHLAMATDVMLLPIHLAEILKALPPGYLPLTPLKIFCTGAALGPALREQATRRLLARITCPYGINESGLCAFVDENGLGTILPGVELEVIDDDGKVVPYGVEGRIRVRSAEMVRGYLQPDLTREHFVDGWFSPGDLALMPAQGQIRFTGRAQAVLNFGGVKYAPELIEQSLFEAVKADDLAVSASANADAVAELQIALVNSQLDDARLAASLRSRLGPNFAAIELYRLASIPRNATGKIQRQALSEQLHEKLKNGQCVRLVL